MEAEVGPTLQQMFFKTYPEKGDFTTMLENNCMIDSNKYIFYDELNKKILQQSTTIC